MDDGMLDRRPRGRPRGAATKPYVKRVPKVVGLRLPSARLDEFSPRERLQVTNYVSSDELFRLELQKQAKLGCQSAQQVLYDRYRLTVVCAASLHPLVTTAHTLATPPALEKPREVIYVLRPIFDF